MDDNYLIKSFLLRAETNTRCDWEGHIIPKGKYVRLVKEGDCRGKFCSSLHWHLAREHMRQLKKQHGDNNAD